jgi:transcriptional regulator with XRE-family HTH domain
MITIHPKGSKEAELAYEKLQQVVQAGLRQNAASARAYRERSGLSLEQAAERSGLTLEQMVAVEAGHGEYPVTFLTPLAAAYGASIREVFFATDTGAEQA